MKRDFSAMKPREVEGYLRQVILRTFGDEVENQSSILARHGYYSVLVIVNKQRFRFHNFRKGNAGKIARAIAALK